MANKFLKLSRGKLQEIEKEVEQIPSGAGYMNKVKGVFARATGKETMPWQQQPK